MLRRGNMPLARSLEVVRDVSAAEFGTPSGDAPAPLFEGDEHC